MRDYDELLALPLDHRTAFVLSLVDGRITVEELVHETGWNDGDALAAIAHLVAMGALELRDPGQTIPASRADSPAAVSIRSASAFSLRRPP